MKRTLLLFLLLTSCLLAHTQVVINELIGSTTGTDSEFIELYNASCATVTISGWTIEVWDSDAAQISTTADRVITIPSGTLTPGQFYLLGSPEFVSAFGITPDLSIADNTLENGSYTIILKNAAGAAQSSIFVVDADAGDFANDEGVAITPDLTVGPDGTFLPAGFTRTTDGGNTTAILEFSPKPAPSATPMNLASVAPTSAGSVLINELIGSTTGADTEFIELYNGGGTTIDISGWVIEIWDSDAGQISATPDQSITIPASPTLAPGEHCLLGSPEFTTIFGITPDIPFADNTLENGSYTIILKDASNMIQNSVFVTDGDAGDTPNDGGVTITPDLTVGPDGTFLPAGFTRIPDGGCPTSLLEFSPRPAPSATPMGKQTVTLNCVPISQVQGSGTASPELNNTVTIKGIVIHDTQGAVGTSLSGFFVQEEDADADADPLTSEGVFVFDGATPLVDVNVGDLVEVTGQVQENFDNTEINVTAGGSVSITSSGNPLPTVTMIDLPVSDVSDFEAWEGMYVTFIDDLDVTEFFNWDRFGEIGVSETERFEQFTECNTPNATAYAAHLLAKERRYITIDDNRSGGQNVFPMLLPDGTALSPTNSIRGNDIISGLTGALDYADGLYKVQPIAATINRVNPRPATPPNVGGNIKVASVNVLNYFNGDGLGGGFPTPRGAETAADFALQKNKIAKAICAMDADIIGLQEIENDGFGANSAIQDLINAISAECGTQYAFVDPGTGTIGTDAICIGLIYKTSTITESGTAALLTAPLLGSSPPDVFTRNRVPLAQTFQVIAGPDTGEQLTVTVNHFKSKGSSCGPGDDDTTTGQANCNGMRTAAAMEVTNWLTTNPTGVDIKDQLIIGDINAYRQEDPIVALESAGFTNLAPAFNTGFPCNGAYSFVFGGEWGSLDHGLASLGLLADVTGAADWHVNADESDAWDYSTEFNDPSYYEDNFYRFSDHDPLLIGLDLNTSFAGVQVAPKVFLQGPLAGTLMNADLNPTLLPSIEPYTGLGYTFLGGGGESISASVAGLTGNDEIVDWVIVELRSSAAPATILASRAALLQRDGDVVDVDGVSPVCVSGVSSALSSGMYHVAVRHRNHLGVMTNAAIMLNP